ncbi:hypothetical protein TWF694_009562 [Orbilia ellipsospora]|uniref:G domain-containing protein n=1 Tax=Orbilia ellipsospora TaxID=2528407 RepID=A0AAV9XC14_9PEZI
MPPRAGPSAQPQNAPPAYNTFSADAILEGTIPGLAPPRPQAQERHRATTPPANKFGPHDLFIAVMGITGSGKSSFISLLSDEPVEIGHGLKSHTSAIAIYPMNYLGKTVHLIDTPGFDDTYRQDIDILKDIAFWLSTSYKENIQLSGIIYLHRITDNRVGGTARKDLNMFKKLCGEESFANVVLATTMWENVSPREGNDREETLRTSTEFYGSMVQMGSAMYRHTGDRNSAMNIINHLVNKRTTTILNIQREMATGLSLDETAAGKELDGELRKQKREFERRLRENRKELEAALKQQNDAMARDLADKQEELQRSLAAAQKVRDDLKIDMQRLMEEKEREFKKAMEELERERKERNRVMEQRQRENEDFKKALRDAEERFAQRERDAQREFDLERRRAQEQDNIRMQANLRAAQADRERRDAEMTRMQRDYMAAMASASHQPLYYGQTHTSYATVQQQDDGEALGEAIGTFVGGVLAIGAEWLIEEQVCSIM